MGMLSHLFNRARMSGRVPAEWETRVHNFLKGAPCHIFPWIGSQGAAGRRKVSH